MKIPLKILFVEDSEDDAALIARQLERSGYQLYRCRVNTPQAYRTALDSERWDVILYDFSLQGFTPEAAMGILRERELEIPFILVSGLVTDEAATAALKAGAHDFISKRNLSRLETAIDRELREAQVRMARQQAEGLARETQRRLAVLVENFPGVVYRRSHKKTWEWEFVSEGIVALTECSPDELLQSGGLTYDSLISPEDQEHIWTEVQKASAAGGPYAVEYRIMCKSGQRKWVWERGSCLSEGPGKPTMLEGFILDITIRKLSEESQRQEVRTKEELLSHVSHELRTPLTSVHQFVSLLLDGLAGEMSPKQTEYLDITFRNIIQLRGMINDLLEVTRAETGKLAIEPRCTFIGGLIAETMKTLGRQGLGNLVELSANVPSDLPPVHADPQRVQQILANLLDNARKFSPLEGKIEVSAGISKSNPNYICISVQDQGCGIAANEQERIFEYLYQGQNVPYSSRKGLGMGLYVCKQLVERQGGEIWVESKPGQGSCFSFTLPLFSLAEMLLPVTVKDDQLKRGLTLVSIKLVPQAGLSASRIGEGTHKQVWKHLQTCLNPATDILLPQLATGQGENLFFAVACSDEREGLGLVERIVGELNQVEELRSAKISYALENHHIQVHPDKSSRQPRRAIELASESIVSLMRNKLGKGGEYYVQEENTNSR